MKPPWAAGAVAGPAAVVHNRVLALLVLAGVAAAFGLACLSVAPNRLVTGTGVRLPALLVGGWRILCVPAAALMAAPFVRGSRWLHVGVVVAAAALLAGLFALAGSEAADRAATGTGLERVSFGGGFWLLAVLTWLAAADALQRLALPFIGRTLLHGALWLPVLALLASGALDQLSLMKEYANRHEVFQAAGWRHLQIVLLTLAFALPIGVALGVAAARSTRLARPLFAVLNVIQTVPSIALFGLLMAPLAGLALLLPGSGVRAIGLLPAVIALTLYALLPLVHGTAAGLRQVPSAVIEAATGMGFTPRQVFWQVEVPLALPVLWSGLRVTTVQLIGLAVVAALIGAGGYGALVFQGLLSSALDLVLLGTVPVIVFALVADAGFRVAGAALAGPAR